MKDNKDYINTFIKRQRIISIICISFVLLSSTISAMAVSAYLYNSNEVSYNNNASGISSTNVQGAIDELYEHATDYTSMNTRVSALEGYFKNNPTSYFDGGSNEWLRMGIDNSIVGNRGIRIYGANNKIRTQFYHDGGSNVTELNSYDSSGASGQGELKIVGKPININATSGGSGDINLNGNVKINGNELNEIVTGSFSKAVTASTLTTVKSFSLTKGTWLVFSRMNLGDGISSSYNHYLNSIVVRSTGNNGGGSINAKIIVVSASSASVEIAAYVPTATTVSGEYYAVRIK